MVSVRVGCETPLRFNQPFLTREEGSVEKDDGKIMISK